MIILEITHPLCITLLTLGEKYDLLHLIARFKIGVTVFIFYNIQLLLFHLKNGSMLYASTVATEYFRKEKKTKTNNKKQTTIKSPHLNKSIYSQKAFKLSAFFFLDIMLEFIYINIQASPALSSFCSPSWSPVQAPQPPAPRPGVFFLLFFICPCSQVSNHHRIPSLKLICVLLNQAHPQLFCS